MYQFDAEWRTQYECPHEQTEVREFTYRNDSKHLHPVCTKCGYRLPAIPKEKNKTKRRDGVDNDKHVEYHRAKSPDGKIHCALCDIREDEPTGGFEIHHIAPIGENEMPDDRSENTIPLCTGCHQKQQIDRRRVQRIREQYKARIISEIGGIYVDA